MGRVGWLSEGEGEVEEVGMMRREVGGVWRVEGVWGGGFGVALLLVV